MDEPGQPDLADLKRRFDICDPNGDGLIDLDEFHELLIELDGDVSREECELDFLAVDTNEDGHISFDEFSVWWLG
jgi:Ca2+-binding EF-hand superfamily protein